MNLLKKIEESAAKQLMKLFLNSKKYADQSIKDLEKAEKALEDAKNRARDATQREYESAVQAAEKAKQISDRLAVEAIAAEQRAKEYSRN